MTLLEVAVQTASDATLAVNAGADRLELCSALALGGLTPSPGLLDTVLVTVPTTPVHVLVRVRAGDFVYDRDEITAMRRDISWCTGAGAGAVVVGAVTPDGSLDLEALAAFVDAAEGLPVLLHRAVDTLSDPAAAVDDLVSIGVSGVLTSGGATRVADGLLVIAAIAARGQLDVVAGGGLVPSDIPTLRALGVQAVHTSAKGAVRNATPMAFGASTDEAARGILGIDPAVVEACARALRETTA